MHPLTIATYDIRSAFFSKITDFIDEVTVWTTVITFLMYEYNIVKYKVRKEAIGG